MFVCLLVCLRHPMLNRVSMSCVAIKVGADLGGRVCDSALHAVAFRTDLKAERFMHLDTRAGRDRVV